MRVSWRHPLSRDLRVLYPFNEGAGGALSATGFARSPAGIASSGGSLVTRFWVPGSGKRGQFAARHTATDDREQLGKFAEIIPLSNVTIAYGYRKTDGINRGSYGFAGENGGGASCYVHLPYSDGTVYWDFGGNSEGSTRLSVGGLTFGDDFWVFTTGPRGMEIWQNGIRRASNSANPTRSAGTGVFTLGEGTGLGAGDLAEISYFATWWRQLTMQEIISLSNAPYQMFPAPRGQMLSLVGSGGGGGGGVGSSSASRMLLGVG